MSSDGYQFRLATHLSDPVPPERLSLPLLAAIAVSAVYFAYGITLAGTRPGLQGDEAYLLMGVVRLLRGHSPIQLMATPYHGSLKTYVLWPVFAVTGVSVFWARVVSLTLGFAPVLGVGWFVRPRFGDWPAVAAMAILAIHPGYVTAMVFDSTGLPLMMLALGGVLLSLRYLLLRRDPLSAFLLGTMIGLGGWARANFIWPAAALVIALILLRDPVIRSWRRLALPFLCGGITGSLPLLLYEVLSGAETFSYMTLGSKRGFPGFADRFRVLVDVIFYDAHRRYIWGAPDSPILLTAVCVGVLLSAVWLGLGGPSRARPEMVASTRLVSLWLVLTIGLTFTTRMPLGPHHFLAYLPICVLVVVSAFAALPRETGSSIVIGVIAAGYLLGVVLWDVRTVNGLRKTRGIDLWSDSIETVEREVEARANHRDPRIVSWGPNFSLYVLSDGRIDPVPLFWKRSALVADSGKSWDAEVRDGGLFVVLSNDVRDVPTTADAFRTALFCSGRRFESVIVRQRDGRGFAEIYDIPPPQRAHGATMSGGKLE